jgi:hypothetical protein
LDYSPQETLLVLQLREMLVRQPPLVLTPLERVMRLWPALLVLA